MEKSQGKCATTTTNKKKTEECVKDVIYVKENPHIAGSKVSAQNIALLSWSVTHSITYPSLSGVNAVAAL